jgi:hypothetical protein
MAAEKTYISPYSKQVVTLAGKKMIFKENARKNGSHYTTANESEQRLLDQMRDITELPSMEKPAAEKKNSNVVKDVRTSVNTEQTQPKDELAEITGKMEYKELQDIVKKARDAGEIDKDVQLNAPREEMKLMAYSILKEKRKK